MAVFEAHGFLLITFSPVSPDCLRTRCRRLLYTSNPYTVFFYGVPRRLWVNVGALPRLCAQPGFSGWLGGCPMPGLSGGHKSCVISFSSAVQDNVHTKARSLFVPLNSTKLEFTLRDTESAGILTCYT